MPILALTAASLLRRSRPSQVWRQAQRCHCRTLPVSDNARVGATVREDGAAAADCTSSRRRAGSTTTACTAVTPLLGGITPVILHAASGAHRHAVIAYRGLEPGLVGPDDAWRGAPPLRRRSSRPNSSSPVNPISSGRKLRGADYRYLNVTGTSSMTTRSAYFGRHRQMHC